MGKSTVVKGGCLGAVLLSKKEYELYLKTDKDEFDECVYETNTDDFYFNDSYDGIVNEMLCALTNKAVDDNNIVNVRKLVHHYDRHSHSYVIPKGRFKDKFKNYISVENDDIPYFYCDYILYKDAEGEQIDKFMYFNVESLRDSNISTVEKCRKLYKLSFSLNKPFVKFVYLTEDHNYLVDSTLVNC